jgi:hypothetical protein
MKPIIHETNSFMKYNYLCDSFLHKNYNYLRNHPITHEILIICVIQSCMIITIICGNSILHEIQLFM